MFNLLSILQFLGLNSENAGLFIVLAGLFILSTFFYMKIKHKFDLIDKEIQQAKKDAEKNKEELEKSIDHVKTDLEKSINNVKEHLDKDISHIKIYLTNHVTDTNKKIDDLKSKIEQLLKK